MRVIKEHEVELVCSRCKSTIGLVYSDIERHQYDELDEVYTIHCPACKLECGVKKNQLPPEWLNWG
jgi:DNA-directed RNA polymerase subunit RPC12/RpoP